MDFYFTNRDFKLLGIASTGSSPIQVSDDTDDELGANSVGRSYTATLNFDAAQIHKVRTMAAMGNFVLYKDYRGRYVFMTIMEWTGFEPWGGTLSFVAENGGIDLINETVGSYTATKALSAADYIDLFTTDSGFEVGINEIAGLTRQLKWDGESDTALQRIESVATQFDAEIDFRFDVSGTAVVKRYIDIYKRVGADKGQRLEVNTHLNKITTTGNIYDLYTSVVATGGTPEGSDSPITLAGYKWTDPEGRYVLTEGGVLMDTVANQKWSRFGAGGAVASITGGYINRVISYTASTQPELLQSALTGLKKATDPACNYDVEIVELPIGVDVGDTVHAVDELQDLNLSTRLLELKTSYAEETRKATLGDFLIEMDQIDPQLKELAESIKMIKAQTQWYPWTRYADDDQGTGISTIATDKAYMATIWRQSPTPSDDPADYAGKWQRVTGQDGSDGEAGPAGDDGQTPYLHRAYATSADGKTGFSLTDTTGKTYLGTYTDFVKADSTDPSKYTWLLTKGDPGIDGKDGAAGKDITSYASGTTLPSTVAPANSQFWLLNSNGVATGFYRSNGSTWVSQPISASTMTTGELDAAKINVVNINGGNIKSESITADKLATDQLLVGLNNSLSTLSLSPNSLQINSTAEDAYNIGLDPTNGLTFLAGKEVVGGIHGGIASNGISAIDEYLQPKGNAMRWGFVVSDTEAHILMALYKNQDAADIEGHPAGLALSTNLQVQGDFYSRSATSSANGHVHFSEVTLSNGTGGISLVNDLNSGIEWDNDGNVVLVIKGVRHAFTYQ